MEKRKTTADATIVIVQKSAVKDHKIVADKKKWVAIDGKPHGRGHRVDWQILDSGSHDLEIYPPEVIIPESLEIKGNHAKADIYAGAKRGYYEYVITVDGEDVEGGSAPGIIIE